MESERVAVLICIALISAVKPLCTSLDVEDSKPDVLGNHSFEQRLDHFNASNNMTFNQMFWEKCNLYEDGGPVFLSIGGYSNVTDPWPENTAMEWYAREHKALIFKVEHRFYGESIPKLSKEKYLDLKYLKYLSAAQALADLANFIQTMNKKHPLLKERSSPPRWVAFGCSYAGSLATWLRTKYSHLVYAAVASSAPLLARHDSPEYKEEIANIIEDRRPDCGTEFKIALYNLKQNTVFEPCNITKKDTGDYHETTILLNLVLKTSNLAQSEENTTLFCDTLLDKNVESPVERLVAGLSVFGLNMTDECHNGYRKCLEAYKLNDGPSVYDERCPLSRQFKYQQCNEFGYFQSWEETGDRLPLFSIYQCSSIFGPQFSENFITAAIKRYNMEYGGLSMETSRVVTVHGSLDPWRKLGLMSPKNSDSPVFIIKGATHCMDQIRDPQRPNVTAVQDQVSHTLGQWLDREETLATVTGHESQDGQEGVTIPWWVYLLMGLLVGCALLLVFVVLKFRKTRPTLQP